MSFSIGLLTKYCCRLRRKSVQENTKIQREKAITDHKKDNARLAEKAADHGTYKSASEYTNAFLCELERIDKARPPPEADDDEGGQNEVSKQNAEALDYASAIEKIAKAGLSNKKMYKEVREKLEKALLENQANIAATTADAQTTAEINPAKNTCTANTETSV